MLLNFGWQPRGCGNDDRRRGNRRSMLLVSRKVNFLTVLHSHKHAQKVLDAETRRFAGLELRKQRGHIHLLDVGDRRCRFFQHGERLVRRHDDVHFTGLRDLLGVPAHPI